MTVALHDPPPLTVNQVAEALQVSPRTVLDWIEAGSLRAVRLPSPGNPRKVAWRVPRSEMDPYFGPATAPSTTPANDTHRPADGGYSREELRRRAGLPQEPGPSQTYPDPSAPTDTPSGSVAPTHPDKPKPVVRMASVTTRPADHPSTQYLPAEERIARRAAEQHAATERLATLDSESPSLVSGVTAFEGEEAPPFDGTSFGAGPAPEYPDAA